MLRQMMKGFEPISLITTLSAASVYPPNSLFLGRFRYLIAEVLTIHDFESSKQATPTDISLLLDAIPDQFRAIFATAEDFIPHDLFDEIMVCVNGKERQFFYADLEQPYAMAEQLLAQANIITSYTKKDFHYSFEAIVEFMFKYQDYLVTSLRNHILDKEVKSQPSEDFVAPPQEFILFWQEITCKKDPEYTRFLTDISSFYKWLEQSGLNSPTSSNTFLPFANIPLFTNFSDNLIMPLPQLGIELLLHQVQEIASNLSQVDKSQLRQDIRNYAFREAETWVPLVFHLEKTLPNVEIRAGEKHVEIPFLAQADKDKLVVYEFAISLGDQNELNVSVKNALQKLMAVEEIFTQYETITIESPKWGQPIELDLDTPSELILILVIHELGFPQNAIGIENAPSSALMILSGESYKSLSLELNDSLDFVDFALAWHQLNNEVEMTLVWNILDAFEIYRDHNHSFFSGGRLPNFIVFDPHAWSTAEHKRLAEQQHWHKLKCRNEIPNYVRFELDSSSLKYYDPFNRTLWAIIFSPDEEHHIAFQVGSLFTSHTVYEINQAFFEGLFFRLDDQSDKFWDFCTKTLNLSTDYLKVFLLAANEVGSNENLQDALDTLQANKDKMLVGQVLYENKLTWDPIIVLICNSDVVINNLQAEDNIVERDFLSTLLTSIAEIFRYGDAKVIEQIDDFVEGFLPRGKKSIGAFPIISLSVPPQKREPNRTREADLSWVKSKISRHVFSKDISQGEYFGPDAITIITETVYPFLMSLLQEYLKTYDKLDLLVHAYKLLEETESYRHSFKNRTSAHAKHALLAYDPVSKLADINIWLTSQSLTLSTLVELILQYPHSGSQYIGESEWGKLFAIATELQRVTNVDELIRQEFRETASVRIDEHYRFVAQIGVADEKINFWESHLHNERIMLSSYHFVPNSDRDKSKTPSSIVDLSLKPVDKAFKQHFGVSIDNLAVVIFSLASNQFQLLSNSLMVAHEDEIVSRLLDDILDIDKTSIVNALKMLTINSELLSSAEINLRKQREREARLAASPLVQINTEHGNRIIFGPYYVYRALGIWLSYIQEGTLPLRPIPEPLQSAFDKYVNIENIKYEEELLHRLQEAKFLARKITDGQLKKIIEENKITLAKFPGDIDGLVVLPEKDKLIVLDAKRLIKSTTPRQMRREYNKFFRGNNSYSIKLARKVEFVRDFWEEIFEYLGLHPNPNHSNWKVEGVFVTNRVIVTAFSTGIDFPIIVDDELEIWLREL